MKRIRDGILTRGGFRMETGDFYFKKSISYNMSIEDGLTRQRRD